MTCSLHVWMTTFHLGGGNSFIGILLQDEDLELHVITVLYGTVLESTLTVAVSHIFTNRYSFTRSFLKLHLGLHVSSRIQRMQGFERSSLWRLYLFEVA